MPLRMGLEMDDCVNPFAPALEAFAHPERTVTRALGNIRGPRSNEIAKRFVLERKGLQGAKKNRGQRVVTLSEAIKALEQAMEFLLIRIPKYLQKPSLGMPLLHRRPVRTISLCVTGRSICQELAQPSMNQHGIQ